MAPTMDGISRPRDFSHGLPWGLSSKCLLRSNPCYDPVNGQRLGLAPWVKSTSVNSGICLHQPEATAYHRG